MTDLNTESTGAKIGLHGIAPSEQYFADLRAAAAQGTPIKTAKFVDELPALADVKRDSPTTLTVGRLHHSGEGVEGVEQIDPNDDDALREVAVELMRPIFDWLALNPTAVDYLDYIEIANEPDPPPTQQERDDYVGELPEGSEPGQIGYYNLGRVFAYCIQIGAASYPSMGWGIGSFNAGTPEYLEMIAFTNSGVFAEAVAHGKTILCYHDGPGAYREDAPIDVFFGERLPDAPEAVPDGGLIIGRINYFADVAGDDMIPAIATEFYYGGGYGDVNDIHDRAVWVDEWASRQWFIWDVQPFTHACMGQWCNQDYAPAYAGFLAHMNDVSDRVNAAKPNTPEPPVEPPPTGCEPRVAYARTYVLIPPAYGREWVDAATAASWNLTADPVDPEAFPRWTVGGSADDAGHGPGLSERTVVAVNAGAWADDDGDALEAFFAEYYPGVVYIPITAVDPADLTAQLVALISGEPVEPPPVEPPTPVVASFGLHMRADGGAYPGEDIDRIAQIKPTTLKFMTIHDPASIASAMAATTLTTPPIVRIFQSGWDREITPQNFIEWNRADIERTRAALPGQVILWEVHNEPNLTAEGLGSNWATGGDFASWFNEVAARLRALIGDPSTNLIMFPGLSPGDSIDGVRRADWVFADEAKAFGINADAIGVHAYWAHNWPLDLAVQKVEQYVARFGLPTYVTEASNNKRQGFEGEDVAKAGEYVDFVTAVGQVGALAVTYFVMSASNPIWNWTTGSGEVFTAAMAADLQDRPTTPTGFIWSHWPTDFVFYPGTNTIALNQAFGANPANYIQFGLPGHEGLDLYAPTGSRIMSVAPGVVYAVDPTAGGHNYGVHVRVEHADGYKSIYAHLADVNVAVGQSIAGGFVIGHANNTGNSFGSHLHLTMKRPPFSAPGYPSNIIDPTPFMNEWIGRNV